MKNVLLTLAFLCTSFSLIAFEKLNVKEKSAYISLPPYAYTIEGKAKGAIAAVTTPIFEELGIDLDATEIPAARLFAAIAAKEIPFWTGFYMPLLDVENKDKPGAYYFHKFNGKLGTAIYTMNLNIYSLDKAFEYKAPEDLKGKSVIILRGYAMGALGAFIRDPKNGITFNEANSHSQALKQLAAKRADLLIDYADPVTVALKTVPIKNIKSTTIQSLEGKFGILDTYPKKVEISIAFEEALTKLIKSGKYKKLWDAALKEAETFHEKEE